MANHKSSKKRIRQTADQARPQPSLPQDGTQCRESAPQHHGEERRRGPASQGNRHAGQTCKAQHRAQEQGRQPQKRHPAARERALSHFAQNSKPPDEGGFFISSPHLTFRLTASGNTPPPRRSPAATPPLSDIPTYTVKKKPPAHLRTARSPTLSGNSRTVYSFSANPCARSRISDPSGVTR